MVIFHSFLYVHQRVDIGNDVFPKKPGPLEPSRSSDGQAEERSYIQWLLTTGCQKENSLPSLLWHCWYADQWYWWTTRSTRDKLTHGRNGLKLHPNFWCGKLHEEKPSIFEGWWGSKKTTPIFLVILGIAYETVAIGFPTEFQVASFSCFPASVHGNLPDLF